MNRHKIKRLFCLFVCFVVDVVIVVIVGFVVVDVQFAEIRDKVRKRQVSYLALGYGTSSYLFMRLHFAFRRLTHSRI